MSFFFSIQLLFSLIQDFLVYVILKLETFKMHQTESLEIVDIAVKQLEGILG